MSQLDFLSKIAQGRVGLYINLKIFSILNQNFEEKWFKNSHKSVSHHVYTPLTQSQKNTLQDNQNSKFSLKNIY